MAASLPPQTVGPGSVDPLAQLRDKIQPVTATTWLLYSDNTYRFTLGLFA